MIAMRADSYALPQPATNNVSREESCLPYCDRRTIVRGFPGESMLSRSAIVMVAVTSVLLPQLNAQTTHAAARKGSSHAKVTSEKKPLTPVETAIATLSAARTFEQVAISPDAKKVAWVESLSGRMESRPAIPQFTFLLPMARLLRAVSRPALASPRTESGIAWSPRRQAARVSV